MCPYREVVHYLEVKMYQCDNKGFQSVSFIERIFLVCSLFVVSIIPT